MTSYHPDARCWFRGYLPHIEVIGVPMFLTWTLIDAIPKQLRERARLLANDEKTPEERRAKYRRVIERIADQGYGSLLLRDHENARIVAGALGFWADQRYQLHSWCVMPNHVHALVTLFKDCQLDELIASWKKYTSGRITRPPSMGAHLWHREYFDRFARNDRDTERWTRYIVNNPARAGLTDWPWVSPAPESL